MIDRFALSCLAPLALLATVTAVKAAPCPSADTLGTSRTLVVDPKTTPRVGLKSFPQTLPLADKEVVLTFDDGPHPPTTKRILDALAKQCVRATFFLIGKHAAANAAMVKRMAADGHTIGHHSLTHPNMGHISETAAIDDIDRGIAADELALNGTATRTPTTPFFRFPYFESTPALLDLMQSRNIAVFGADLWASDWNPMTPQQQLALITSRLAEAHKGIILFHDPKAQTAAMIPAFLDYLRVNHYRVVHVVAPPTQPQPQLGRAHGL
jgi:peptidoglycan/xylan/chitin deacetylase (PgdA/CDA1 family)